MPFHPAFVTILACFFMVLLSFAVGRARQKFNIAPPETRGHPRFETIFRAQQNTTESMVMFLPILWVLTGQGLVLIATILGWIWLISRILYVFGYASSQPSRRMAPFLISILCITLGFLISAISLIQSALQ